MTHVGKLALLAIVISLSGCQSSTPKQSAAEPIAKSTPVVTMEQASRCNDDVNKSEVGKRVFSQLLYNSNIASEYTHIETSTQYLNDAQVELLKEFREKNKECRSLRLQAFKGYEYRTQLSIFYAEMDVLFDDMQNKRIPIGQANVKANEIRVRYQAEIRKIYERSKEFDENRLG